MSKNRFEQCVEQAKEIFKNHIATYKDYGENEIKVLHWGQPNTINCYMNIVFQKHFIYISGDLREAVYDCTWQTSLKNCAKNDFSYFTGKLSCSKRGKMDWNYRWCEEDIEEWYQDRFIDIEEDEKEELKEFKEELLLHSEDKFEFISFIRDSELDKFEERCESS